MHNGEHMQRKGFWKIYLSK